MPDVTDLRPGDPEEIAGYHVVSRLGAGGQGVVYLATAPSGDRVAIKQLRFGPQDDRARQQFAKEVAAARLVAPFCTAQVLDVELEGPAPYVVSEYIDGPSLQQRIERRGPMTGATLQRLAIGTATALAAIHQVGVVHRDFKPANVMLAYDGPRVIDFGIARDLSTETTVTSRIFGTPAYMAPEQLRAERVGPATDMFAWASVIAYAATGRAPFEAPHMMAVMHRISSAEADLTGVPADLLAVLRQCLDKDPAGRPSAQQVLALLLGRPAPARDASDPTQVLAEATGIVHAAAAASTTQDAPPTRAAQAAPAAPTSPFVPAPTVQQGVPAPTVQQQGVSAPTMQEQGAQAPRAQTHTVPAPPAARPWGAGTVDPHRAGYPSAPGAGSKSPWTLVALALSLPVLAVLLVYGLGNLMGAGDPKSPSAGATSPSTGQERGADPATEPSDTWTSDPEATTDGDNGNGDETEEGTVPEFFDGTWEGTGRQPKGRVKSWTAQVELDEGESTGRLSVLELDCSGELTLTSASDGELELVAVMDDNPDGACAPRALLRLTRKGSDRLAFYWVDAANEENEASGVLRRN